MKTWGVVREDRAFFVELFLLNYIPELTKFAVKFKRLQNDTKWIDYE